MDFQSPSVENIQPVKVDGNIRFSSVGGLKEHIRCLREMIIFPLMYPELFKKFNTRPAKGVLFHGPPGTGKTLLARALANECSLVCGRKVSFFMRKGADVMKQYYGQSEKTLRMLFEKARQMKPSIIFFDEVDALAPVRMSPSEGQTYNSVIATLLAEMDGLCDRGDVVVIGATNRPDALDPAVRRMGRFDRELYFPPPEADARRDILAIYTSEWEPSLGDDTLDHIAQLTVGYLGSDIKSLCSEAVLKAVRRVYPQIYESDHKLLVNATDVQVTTGDLLAAMEALVPAGRRYVPPAAHALPAHLQPLLNAQLIEAASVMRRAAPLIGNKNNTGSESVAAPSVFLVIGECAETYIAPALLAQLEHCIVQELSLSTLHSAHMGSPKQAVISLFADCRRTGRPCIIFIRDVVAVWQALAGQRGAAVLLQLWRLRSVADNTLLLATCPGCDVLPAELQEIFPAYKDCIYRVRQPTVSEVNSFLSPVIMEMPLVPPVVYKNEPPPPLPRAPPVVPKENEEDMVHRLFQEYENLQILRACLRSICYGLIEDRRYLKFTVPVDVEAVPDYLDVIQQPMDLSTVMSKLDNKEYFCAKEFLSDIELICTNALQYSRIKSDRKFRYNAPALYTEAHARVAEEVDAQLELECQLIARRRRQLPAGDDDDMRDARDHIYFSKLPELPSFSSRDLGRFSKSTTSEQGRKREADSHKKNRSAKCSRIMSKEHKERGIVIKEDDDKPTMSLSDQGLQVPSKERQSDTLQESNNVMIDTAELVNIMKPNIEPLSHIGLVALIDLHTQLSKAVYAYADARDRTQLPREMRDIVNRYVQLAKA